MKGRWSAVMALLFAASEWVSPAAARPDEFRPPANLKIDPFIQSTVDRMWDASPTFRRQCRRLASETALRVAVLREDQPGRNTFANARTALTFQGSTPVNANVYLKTAVNAAELIAHELEHIIEQLDHVDLGAQAGNGAVWRSDRTSFETRRAIEIGRRVGRELMEGAKRREGAAEGARSHNGAPLTLQLNDADATPLSERTARISSDGRFVVFISSARLVDNDRNNQRDVYVTEIRTGRTTLESVAVDDGAADGASVSADISADGRWVVFESQAGNLTTATYPAGTPQIFLRDRVSGTTRLLTTNTAGGPANGPSWHPVISGNGAAVAFESAATNLLDVAGEKPQGAVGIYLIRFATAGRIRLDTVTSGRPDAVGSSMSPAIDADGRYVVFSSKADLTCEEKRPCESGSPTRNRLSAVYIYDTQSNTRRRVSHAPGREDSDGASYDPAISGDGRVVAFVSDAANLTPGSQGRTPQVYRHDLASQTTSLVSRTLSGRPANGSSLRPALSFDGSTVVFQSLATNLLCDRKHCPPELDDFNLLWDVFLYEARTNSIGRLSTDDGEGWMENSRTPSIDGAGHVVAFGSWHPVDADDIVHDEDLYVVRVEPARLLSTRQPK